MTMQPQADAAAEQAQADAAHESDAPKPIDGFSEMSLQARQQAILERHGETGDDDGGRVERHRPQTDASGTGDIPAKADDPADGDGGTADADKAKADAPDDELPKSLDELPAYLEKRAAAEAAKLEEVVRERLDNQRRSMIGENEAWKEQQRQQTRLTELLEMSDEDLAALVKTDQDAAQILAAHTAAGDPEVEARAIIKVAERTTPQMFAAAKIIAERGGPDLEAIMAKGEGTPEFDAMRNPEASVYGWLVEQASTTAVEEFKKSPEFKAALEEARTQGKNDAVGGLGQPAAAERGVPSRKGQEPLSDDPKVRAVQRAAAATGATDVDYDEIGAGNGRRSRR